MKTVTSAFAARVAAQPAEVALRRGTGTGTGVSELTWSQYADEATRFAAALQHLGLRRGERVALMLRNRLEFHVADMGVLLAGGTPVSIYNSSPSERIAYMLRHAEARIAVVEDVFSERFASTRPDIPGLKTVIGVGACEDESMTSLLASDPVDLGGAAADVDLGDLLTIIYTSGTTGDPKGVPLTHANVGFAVDTYSRVLGRTMQGLRQLSFLPMAHIAERIVTHYFHVAHGTTVTTCDDVSALQPTMAAAKPEWFFSPPRLWEKLQGDIEALVSAGSVDARDFADARRLGWTVFLAERDGSLSTQLTADWGAARAEHVIPVLSQVGLGDVVVAMTGAAPMARHTSEFFLSLGVPLSEVWGMSETAGLGSWSPHRIFPGTVGQPVPGVEMRLGADDEILVRGPCVFGGYLNDPARTAEVLDADGWLHTGDVGRFDAGGNLSVIDRIKDIIVPSSGHNVSPTQLEARLKQCPLISQACVVGDGRPHVAALVVPDLERARAWAAGRGGDGSLADIARREDFRAEVAAFIEEVNREVAPAERIATFEILGEEWELDSDVLTPTAKLKRRSVVRRYADVIDRLYS